MTINRDVPAIRLACDGATKAFNLAELIFLARADLKVTLVAADGTPTQWANGNEFTLSGDGTIAEGVLTTNALAAYPLGSTIVVRRDTDDIQNQTFVEGSGFPAQNANNAFDRRTLRSQELSGDFARTLSAPDYDAPLSMELPGVTARKNSGNGGILGFDGATGAPRLANKTLAQLEGYLDDAASLAGVASVIAALIAGQNLSNFSLSIPVSVSASLAAADAAAAAVGGEVVVDKNVALTGDLHLTCRKIRFAGGKIIFGNFHLYGSGQSIDAAVTQIFGLTGTGRLKGFFSHGLHFPVAWVGVIGTDGNQADPWTVSAPYAAANKTLLQALEDYNGQCGYTVPLLFTDYFTASNGPITNPTPGTAAIWCGINRKSTRVYAPDGNILRTLTGNSASTMPQDVYRDLGLFGGPIAGATAPAIIKLINSCFWNIRRCYFSISNSAGILFDQTGGGFSENVIVEDCLWDNDVPIPIKFSNTSGTGSWRGFSLRGHNLWSAGPSSSDTFCQINAGIPYNWHEFNVVVLNQAGRRIYIIDNLSGNVCNINSLHVDAEDDSVHGITISRTGTVASAGGPQGCYAASPTLNQGAFIYNAAIIAQGTNRYIMGGEYDLTPGVDSLTGTAGATDISLNYAGAGIYRVKGRLIDSVDHTKFHAVFIAEVATDAGYGGGITRLVGTPVVQVLENAGGCIFAAGNIGVNTANNKLTISGTFGAHVVKLTGHVILESNGLS